MKSLALSALLLAVSCGGDDETPGCVDRTDCASGLVCIDGTCEAAGSMDAGIDAGVDAGSCQCTAGQTCMLGTCAEDCGNPLAVACGAGRVCDFATGACADEGAPGILTGEGERCGDGPTCLPGTECSLTGTCQPAAPCYSVGCTDDGSTCWGRSCLTERPAGACTPAPLERMNMPDFIAGGDGGAFDLEFDDGCNAYTVTMISGTDYLRQLTPEGELTVWDGVLNLNMGEVAVLRRPGDEFGAGDAFGDVALTYICCAACGCFSGDRQGVAKLDRMGAQSLPMVVLADPSEGTGPLGNAFADTGPYGLTWGRDDRLYVGNVTANGELIRADLSEGTTATIHTLPARIHASATFDSTSLLVALEGGDIVRVHTDSDIVVAWASIGEDVTSLVRDPFTGSVYLSLRSRRIVEYTASGDEVRELAAPGELGRVAYAPDGSLYYLIMGALAPAQVLQFELPSTL